MNGRKVARTASGDQRFALDVVGLDLQLVELHLLGAEALDHPDARDGLLDDAGELRLLLLHRANSRVDAP